MYWIFVLIGLAIAALEILAARSNRVTRATSAAPRLWVSIHQARWIWGLSTALLSVFVIYPLPILEAETLRVAGFPFMVGVFGENGRDFVSSPQLAILTLAANALIWFFLPSLFLWVWATFARYNSGGHHA